MKTLILKATRSEDSFLTSDAEAKTISASEGASISIGKDKELDVIKVCLPDEEAAQLMLSKDCLGTPEDFKKNFQELYEKLTLVAVRLPSPRQEVGVDGKTMVTVTGGVRFVPLAEAKAQDLKHEYTVEHRLGGEP